MPEGHKLNNKLLKEGAFIIYKQRCRLRRPKSFDFVSSETILLCLTSPWCCQRSKVEQRSAQWAHDPKVGGSNPPLTTPTSYAIEDGVIMNERPRDM